MLLNGSRNASGSKCFLRGQTRYPHSFHFSISVPLLLRTCPIIIQRRQLLWLRTLHLMSRRLIPRCRLTVLLLYNGDRDSVGLVFIPILPCFIAIVPAHV
jgi:hypothetical protein